MPKPTPKRRFDAQEQTIYRDLRAALTKPIILLEIVDGC